MLEISYLRKNRVEFNFLCIGINSGAISLQIDSRICEDSKCVVPCLMKAYLKRYPKPLFCTGQWHITGRHILCPGPGRLKGKVLLSQKQLLLGISSGGHFQKIWKHFRIWYKYSFKTNCVFVSLLLLIFPPCVLFLFTFMRESLQSLFNWQMPQL